MISLRKGRYRARFGDGPGDLRAAQQLRYLAFRGKPAPGTEAGTDADAFDARCSHILVEDVKSETLVLFSVAPPVGRGRDWAQLLRPIL
jgi:putative hemolysin